MQSKSWMMMRVLLNRYHPQDQQVLLAALPEGDVQAILSQEITSPDVAAAVGTPESFLEKMHYSWLQDPLQQTPPVLQAMTLSALSPETVSKLTPLLKKAPPRLDKEVAKPIRSFLLKQLCLKFPQALEILPMAFLPKTSLSALADWDKAKLVELIDCLGVYDLAEEMRRIIDQKRVKQLYACLTPQQKPFLRQCLHQKEKVVTTRLPLADWDGDAYKLEQLLHRRGLVRLAKSLCGQHPDVVRHIAYALDTGRGKVVLKHYSPQALKGLTPVLIQQVEGAIQYMHKKGNS